MPDANHSQFDSRLLARLACPACHGELLFKANQIVCAACACAYPIIEGIPVLIASVPGVVSQKGKTTADPSLTTPELKDIRGPVRSG